ncbi:MAG: prolipoprotein diacylglyceryl transferase [Spirochaetales bacterium]|nr:prolipoprotein diacylglyceryl transferase [Spirochaetales bacterium]
MFPIHLDLGFRTFYFYEGFYFLIAIIIGYSGARYLALKAKMNADKFDNFVLFTLLGGIVGGRISSMLIYGLDLLITNPLSLFYFWDGGISIIGALPMGLLFGALYLKKHKLDIWKTTEFIVPPVLLAQAIGRIGCFMNGDGFGTVTNVPWAVRFPKYGTLIPAFKTFTGYESPAWRFSYNQGLISADSPVSAPIHPAALYESLGLFVLFGLSVLILSQVKKGRLSSKLLILWHIGGYSFARFFVEFFRADRSSILPMGISVLQLGLALAFLGCAAMAVFFSLKHKKQLAASA